MFDFNNAAVRKGTGSLKWDLRPDVLPMWVADMDFKTAPCIIEAIEKRVQQGAFGYHILTNDWYEAYRNWWRSRHHWEIDAKWLIFATGIVPAITCLVQRLSNVGDKVLVMTPVYDIFFHSIENFGRHVLESKLTYSSGRYSINWDDMERCMADPLTTLMILCNPHNPAGILWTKDELSQIGILAKRYGVTVISDEIHCDITRPGSEYVPFASVSDTCASLSVTCISPSKAFNIAGINTAAVVVPNRDVREIVKRGLNSCEYAEPNAFAVAATVAAFNSGGQWLDELRTYVYDNINLAERFIHDRLKDMIAVNGGATYLLWLDCSAWTEDTTALAADLCKKDKLWLTAGSQYRGNGARFLRMNLACPESTVREGLKKLYDGMRRQ